MSFLSSIGSVVKTVSGVGTTLASIAAPIANLVAPGSGAVISGAANLQSGIVNAVSGLGSGATSIAQAAAYTVTPSIDVTLPSDYLNTADIKSMYRALGYSLTTSQVVKLFTIGKCTGFPDVPDAVAQFNAKTGGNAKTLAYSGHNFAQLAQANITANPNLAATASTVTGTTLATAAAAVTSVINGTSGSKGILGTGLSTGNATIDNILGGAVKGGVSSAQTISTVQDLTNNVADNALETWLKQRWYLVVGALGVIWAVVRGARGRRK